MSVMLTAAALALMITYPAGLVPDGFYVFCNDHPAECEPVEPAKISRAEWQETLDRINRETNASIVYRREDGEGQKDVWTLSPAEGDCDDYTVTKRQKLIEAGIPRGSMRAAYVLPVSKDPHVFLVVSTDEGDLVLDNRTDEIVEIERSMLLRLSIQDAAYPHVWWQVY